MNKFFILMIAISTVFAGTIAAQCNIDPGTDALAPGLYPEDDADIDPITAGTPYEFTFQFKNFTMPTILGAQVNLDSVEFLEFVGLPSGLTFSTSEADNRYSAGEAGCIKVEGTTNVADGQYPTDIRLRAWVQGIGTIDTLSSTLGIMPTFTVGPVGINELSSVEAFNVSPNPISSTATIRFNATANEELTLRVHDLSGKLLSETAITTTTGFNSYTFNKSNLQMSSGIHLISLTDGTNSVTKRVLVTQ